MSEIFITIAIYKQNGVPGNWNHSIHTNTIQVGFRSRYSIFFRKMTLDRSIELFRDYAIDFILNKLV